MLMSKADCSKAVFLVKQDVLLIISQLASGQLASSSLLSQKQVHISVSKVDPLLILGFIPLF